MKRWKMVILLVLLWTAGLATAQNSTGVHAGLHVAGGAGMSAVVGDVMQRPWLGLVSTVVAGMAKESYDYRVRREPGWSATRDAATVSAGAVMGYVIARRSVARQRRQNEAAARLELLRPEPEHLRLVRGG